MKIDENTHHIQLNKKLEIFYSSNEILLIFVSSFRKFFCDVRVFKVTNNYITFCSKL